MDSPAQRHGGGRAGQGREGREGREGGRDGAVSPGPQRPEPPAARSRSPGARADRPRPAEADTGFSTAVFTESQNPLGWKAPLRSSRPTSDRTPRCPADQSAECHDRLGDSNTSPDSPLQYLIALSGKKFVLILPNVQPKPTLAQLKSVQGPSNCLQKRAEHIEECHLPIHNDQILYLSSCRMNLCFKSRDLPPCSCTLHLVLRHPTQSLL